MTKMIRDGSNLFLAPNANSFETLKPGFYKVGKTITGQFFLSEDIAPTIPSKIYGKSHRNRADRIIGAFNRNTKSSTGALLVGEAGSGKTLLASDIMIREAKTKPVITVASAYYGASFNEFIHNIGSAVVFFDELEKLYDFDESDVLASLLSLFAGSVTSHKLFICTANNKYAIGEHFFNRTGRFRYVCKFDSLEVSAIEEYLTDNLENKTLFEEVRDFSMSNRKINMDVLCALVEEVNIIGNFTDAVTDLNIEHRIDGQYEIISVYSEDGSEWKTHYRHVEICGTMGIDRMSCEEDEDNSVYIYLDKTSKPVFDKFGFVTFKAKAVNNKNVFFIKAKFENPAF